MAVAPPGRGLAQVAAQLPYWPDRVGLTRRGGLGHRRGPI